MFVIKRKQILSSKYFSQNYLLSGQFLIHSIKIHLRLYILKMLLSQFFIRVCYQIVFETQLRGYTVFSIK